MTTDPLVDELRSVVGPEHVLVDADIRAGFEVDWTRRFRGEARAVVRPADPDEVAAAVRVCAARAVPVVAQGGNTGLVGGGVPRGGEVVLSTRRLDWVETVPDADGELVAGAGATLEAVRTVARSTGWDVGVDLASRASATIGGMVATNAGGAHALRYGPMEHQVIGVEAVLADGSTIGRVPALRKDNTGYHWGAILCGSEGTLAIVTRVHLGLVPGLPDRVVALCGVDDLAAAGRIGSTLRRRLDSLLSLEVVFADGVELVRAHTGLPAPTPTPWPAYVVAECGGRAGEAEHLIDALATALAECPDVRATAVGADPPSASRLRAYRELHTEAISAAGIPHKLDVALPLHRLVEFEAAVRRRVRELAPHARVFVFGHVGDGNLHVNVLGPARDDVAVDDAVLELAASMGGSISAEHGIGVAKRSALGLTRGQADIDAMRALKHALDPAGILNPGALFPPPT